MKVTLVAVPHLHIRKRIIEREAACLFDSYSVPGAKGPQRADSTPQGARRDYQEMKSAISMIAGYIEGASR